MSYDEMMERLDKVHEQLKDATIRHYETEGGYEEYSLLADKAILLAAVGSYLEVAKITKSEFMWAPITTAVENLCKP